MAIAIKLATLEAFCQECPPAQEVTAVLESLGFRLVFKMPAITTGKQSIPAQYHYKDRDNTEVIFLAGKDTPEVGERFPVHSSRWWIYPGSSQYSYNLVAREISAKYRVCWI